MSQRHGYRHTYISLSIRPNSKRCNYYILFGMDCLLSSNTLVTLATCLWDLMRWQVALSSANNYSRMALSFSISFGSFLFLVPLHNLCQSGHHHVVGIFHHLPVRGIEIKCLFLCQYIRYYWWLVSLQVYCVFYQSKTDVLGILIRNL